MRIKCEYPESEYDKVFSIEHNIKHEVCYIRQYDRIQRISFYLPIQVGKRKTTLLNLYGMEDSR